jgi:voltage-gated potassium channel
MMPVKTIVEHRSGRWWAAVVAFVALYAAVEVPLRLALDLPLAGWLAFGELVVSVVVGIELVRHLRRLKRMRAAEPEAWRNSDGRRLRSDIMLDAIALVPLLLPLLPDDFSPVALLRLLFLHRAARYADGFVAHGQVHPGVLRLVKFLFWLGLLVHWIACGWLELRAPAEYVKHVPHYVEAAYWALTTVATIGYGDVIPNGTAQMLYAMFVMLLGVGVFSYAIGSVAGLLTSLDAARLEFRDRLSRVHAYLDYHAVPGRLRARILAYYRHLWESRQAWGDDRLLEDLPAGLRVDLALYLHRNILEKVPFLHGAGEELLRDLALALKPAVCTPEEIIFWHGSEGTSMYFVDEGEVDIVSADGTLLKQLGAGEFFGEIALLGARTRNATARSASYAQLFTLDEKDFDRVLSRYPQFEAEVRRLAAQRGFAAS